MPGRVKEVVTMREPMEEFLQNTLEGAADRALVPPGGADGLVFLLITSLGLVMALVYVPIRLFLTITARSRRLRLLQQIRRLRDTLGKPLNPSSPSEAGRESEGQPAP
jgi:hypothetical protein